MKHIVHKSRRPVWPHILRIEIGQGKDPLSTEEVKYISGDWILENKKHNKTIKEYKYYVYRPKSTYEVNGRT